MTYDPIEKMLQSELLKLLQGKYGKKSVVREANYVDLTVNDSSKTFLVEIKSDSDARLAIRKALGQILEYAYFRTGGQNPATELVIIAPGPMTSDVTNYLSHLREVFHIPVSYAAFFVGR